MSLAFRAELCSTIVLGSVVPAVQEPPIVVDPTEYTYVHQIQRGLPIARFEVSKSHHPLWCPRTPARVILVFQQVAWIFFFDFAGR